MPDERLLIAHRSVTRRQAIIGAAASVLAARLTASSSLNTIAPDAIGKLRASYSGELITPKDQGYETARLINNRVFDRQPALIAQCRGAEDVARVLEFARHQHLPVAVRSGGHNIGRTLQC